MKICSNCRAVYNDDWLQFCLRCGIALSARTNGSQSNGKLVAAILSGFALLAVTVGGFGVYHFSRQNALQNPNGAREAIANEQAASDQTANRAIAREQTASVERLGNKSAADANNAPDKLRAVVSASSARQPKDNNFYFPNFAFDNNPATAWCEGASGAGANSWLQFDFGRDVKLKAVKIMPGNFKSQEAWRKNNRVAVVSLQFSDATTRDRVRLEDRMETQTINTGDVLTNSARIAINEVYVGSADGEDTLISEVSFVTEP